MHWIHEEGKVQYPNYGGCCVNREVAMDRRPYRGELSVPPLAHALSGPPWESSVELWVSVVVLVGERDRNPSTYVSLPVES